MTRATLATVAIAILLALALPGAASAACPLPNEFFGIASSDVWEGNEAYQRQQMDSQRSVGIGMMQVVFDWAGTEREPNKYSWARYDRFIALAAQRDIELMPMLFNPPQWRSGRPPGDNSKGVYPPANYADMGDFGAQIAYRYGAHGTYWASHPDVP